VSAEVSPALACRVEWLFGDDGAMTLGNAIDRAAAEFVAPMSLDSLLALADNSRFWGAAVQLKGTLKASITAEANFAGAGWTWGLDGAREAIGYSLGIAVHADVHVAGEFRLKVTPERRGNQWGLRVMLERSDVDGDSLGLAVCAGVDFSALAASADRFVKANLPDPQNLSDMLDLLTQPGTFLREEIRKLLAANMADPQLSDFVLLLAGSGKQDELADALATRATGRLVDAIDRAAARVADGTLLADVADMTDQWIGRAFGNAALANAARAQLRKAVASCISLVTDRVRKLVDELSGRIQQVSRQAATEALAPFARLGAIAAEKLTQAGGNFSLATNDLREAIAEYAARREAVLNALEDAQRAKAKLTIGVSFAQSRSRDALFSGWFAAAPASSLAPIQRLYQALWRGHLDGIEALIQEAEHAGLLSDVECSLVEAGKRVANESISIDILGWKFDNTSTSLLDVSIRSSGSYVVAASGTADITAHVTN